MELGLRPARRRALRRGAPHRRGGRRQQLVHAVHVDRRVAHFPEDRRIIASDERFRFVLLRETAQRCDERGVRTIILAVIKVVIFVSIFVVVIVPQSAPLLLLLLRRRAVVVVVASPSTKSSSRRRS